MRPIEYLHDRWFYVRRVNVIARQLANMLPQNARILDVGTGDGLIPFLVSKIRPDISFEGLDVLVRSKTHIPVKGFDGASIPYPDGAFDVVMLVDVLHHTSDPMILLRETYRVARDCIVVKDHTLNGFLAGPTLRFMDRIGNLRLGVHLAYNYWSRARWMEAFRDLDLVLDVWNDKLGLYPGWVDWVFGRSLHFLALLRKTR